MTENREIPPPPFGLTAVPRYCFFTKGRGVHREKLNSFEMALRDAGIAQFNLVRVSSIFAPRCKIVSQKIGLKYLRPAMILPVVMSENATNEPSRLIASAIGLARPRDPDHHGYISEHHSFGETAKKCGDYSEDLAAQMLATVVGVEFDPNENYDTRREVYRMSGRIVETRHIVQSAEGDKDGLWTTVVSAAVLIL
ncbi:MAG: arginine decarboxylase, pyruvoyl-dependent [Myxococcota bacterium]|mgnify:CR=1 FL=1